MTLLFTFGFELEDLFWASVCRDKIGGFSFCGLSREKILKDDPQSPRGAARFVWGQPRPTDEHNEQHKKKKMGTNSFELVYKIPAGTECCGQAPDLRG